MAAVTWQNIAPSTPSGILNAVNTSGQQIGSGIRGIGDAFNQFAKDKTKLETDSFINNLMQYKDQPDKVQEMIAGANTDWLDMERISGARDTANERSDELSMFTSKEAVKQKNAVALAAAKAKADSIAAAAKKDKGITAFDLTKELTKTNKEAASAPWFTGWLGADTPEEEVRARLQKYFDANNIKGKDAEKQRRIILNDLYFDESVIDEFHTSKGTSIEDTKDKDLKAIIDNYNYKKTTD